MQPDMLPTTLPPPSFVRAGHFCCSAVVGSLVTDRRLDLRLPRGGPSAPPLAPALPLEDGFVSETFAQVQELRPPLRHPTAAPAPATCHPDQGWYLQGSAVFRRGKAKLQIPEFKGESRTLRTSRACMVQNEDTCRE
ncbi:hypothetical protein NDU88_001355 [Pleurodeles waltl]|uniref:Uncharacterized protein n=1 Tax=Pleurodeles waltl TaxID=8319 RepID=A0AAV7U642_PLEWA|nr:hypothetical protein NDU88_001355 [Pleurodeles waltl]